MPRIQLGTFISLRDDLGQQPSDRSMQRASRRVFGVAISSIGLTEAVRMGGKFLRNVVGL